MKRELFNSLTLAVVRAAAITSVLVVGGFLLKLGLSLDPNQIGVAIAVLAFFLDLSQERARAQISRLDTLEALLDRWTAEYETHRQSYVHTAMGKEFFELREHVYQLSAKLNYLNESLQLERRIDQLEASLPRSKDAGFSP